VDGLCVVRASRLPRIWELEDGALSEQYGFRMGNEVVVVPGK
jgi:hypothetical protein